MVTGHTPVRPRGDREKALSEAAVAPGQVHVTGLDRSYGRVKVLDNISFDVPAGSVCTLLGASGSGKTTTLRLLAGLDAPDRGDIYIGGRHVAGRGVMVRAEQRAIGMLFQSYALWPHMKIGEQIVYPLRVRKVTKNERVEALERTAKMLGIERLLDRYPSQLSGGQQQRVGLARALVFDPDLLLLDEPLSGLDAELRRQTQLELQKLQERVGITTVYVTHDQEEAMSFSDQVVVMSEGRISSIAPPREMYDRPATVFVAAFVGRSNLLHGTVSALSGGEVTVRLPDGSTVTGSSAHSLRVDDPAIAVIKPVDVVARPDPGIVQNLLTGVVISTRFVGPRIEVALDFGAYQLELATPRGMSVPVGDALDVHLPPDRVTILPPD